MSNFPVIDTDGHVLERQSDIRKYLEEPWITSPEELAQVIDGLNEIIGT